VRKETLESKKCSRREDTWGGGEYSLPTEKGQAREGDGEGRLFFAR